MATATNWWGEGLGSQGVHNTRKGRQGDQEAHPLPPPPRGGYGTGAEKWGMSRGGLTSDLSEICVTEKPAQVLVGTYKDVHYSAVCNQESQRRRSMGGVFDSWSRDCVQRL